LNEKTEKYAFKKEIAHYYFFCNRILNVCKLSIKKLENLSLTALYIRIKQKKDEKVYNQKLDL
jgi:hypothetical protein